MRSIYMYIVVIRKWDWISVEELGYLGVVLIEILQVRNFFNILKDA